MAGERAAARRIMQQFGEASRIPYLNIEEGDVGVLIAIPVVGLLLAGLTGVQSLALPLVSGGFGLGVAIVYVAPSHVSAWTWLQDVLRFVYRPRQTLRAPAGDGDANRGGVGNYTPFAPDERTQELTNVARAWPGVGVIERSDGAMEAFLEIQPGNMDFAMSDDWATLQAAGAEFANKELDYPLKVHATTRSFPVERITETIESRLGDPDVAENPVFEELLEEYRETRPREMRARGIQEVRYYLGVTVDPIEVYDRFQDEATPAEKLTQFPAIGVLFRPFVTRRSDLSAVERRAKMFETLDSRVASVESEFVQSASGWTARRLSTVELFVLNLEFWNGHSVEYGDPERVVRDTPVIDRAPRKDERDG